MGGVSLSGTFDTMPFPDLMQWLGDTGRSGMLTVTLEFEERYLHIERGSLVGFGSDDPRSRDLARVLLGRGLINEVHLRRATQTSERERRPLRLVLVEDLYLSHDVLAEAVRAHAKDVALQLFLWHEGRFAFSSLRGELLFPELGEGLELRLDPPIPVKQLVIEGMRRIDEWRHIAEILPSDHTIVHALDVAEDLPAVEALVAHGEPVALGDLCLELALPRLEILAQLKEAWNRGLLAVDREPAPWKPDPGHSPIDMLVASARPLLDEKQVDEAAVLLRSALDLDPYHAEARALLHRAREEQLEELYRQFPPYRVPALTGPRESDRVRALPPRDRYLLSRVDGRRDVGALTVMTPMGELETLRALKRFQHVGLVRLL